MLLLQVVAEVPLVVVLKVVLTETGEVAVLAL
jgi:hypothetical protein